MAGSFAINIRSAAIIARLLGEHFFYYSLRLSTAFENSRSCSSRTHPSLLAPRMPNSIQLTAIRQTFALKFRANTLVSLGHQWWLASRKNFAQFVLDTLERFVATKYQKPSCYRSRSMASATLVERRQRWQRRDIPQQRLSVVAFKDDRMGNVKL